MPIDQKSRDLDWSRWQDFGRHEFECRCGCGRADMDPDFMDALQDLRTSCDFPFVINSGYRCENHPAEKHKGEGATTGEHALGKAADIGVSGARARTLLKMASILDFPRIGVKQHGPLGGRFIHVGSATAKDGLPSPTTWSYR
jgi:hypothetical protein